jgi:hypothetical protein
MTDEPKTAESATDRRSDIERLVMPIFSRRVWLNKDTSGSTGAAVAFCGPAKWNNKEQEIHTFFEVSDCHCKVRLHKTYSDTSAEFIEKMRTLSKLASDFADFLEYEA